MKSYPRFFKQQSTRNAIIRQPGYHVVMWGLPFTHDGGFPWFPSVTLQWDQTGLVIHRTRGGWIMLNILDVLNGNWKPCRCQNSLGLTRSLCIVFATGDCDEEALPIFGVWVARLRCSWYISVISRGGAVLFSFDFLTSSRFPYPYPSPCATQQNVSRFAGRGRGSSATNQQFWLWDLCWHLSRSLDRCLKKEVSIGVASNQVLEFVQLGLMESLGMLKIEDDALGGGGFALCMGFFWRTLAGWKLCLLSITRCNTLSP